MVISNENIPIKFMRKKEKIGRYHPARLEPPEREKGFSRLLRRTKRVKKRHGRDHSKTYLEKS